MAWRGLSSLFEPVERSRNWGGKIPEGFRAYGEGNTVRTWVKKSCSG